jgi:hypothetical protein
MRLLVLTRVLTYFLTHPSRGDSLWPVFAGTGDVSRSSPSLAPHPFIKAGQNEIDAAFF